MAPALPIDSARMAWWLSAWLRGNATPDDVRDAVLDGDAAHDLSGLPGADGTTSLLLSLGAIRRSGARSAGLALPAPGHPTGLGGPSDFNAAALESGEAVLLEGADLGLVPARAGAGVVWQVLPAGRRAIDDLGEADRGLRATVAATATALVDLDVARWRPEVADELMNLRHVPTYDAPEGTPPRAVSLAGRALQALGIVELAGEDHGGAMSAHEMARRSDALLPLELAARRAMVAACSPEVWPPA
ncbi:hypothetical protein [Nocardioides jensenii]|uniref:hypothetical protein n=1 Tax=Nocardioides jensenii TaxID=1843 RepID=UPI00083309B1|nr:hypothetical protein [Nocardioides jensenii]